MYTEKDLEFFRQSLPFWAHLTPGELVLATRSMVGMTYLTGDILQNSPDECSGLILVREGQVRAYINSPDGKEITLYRLLSGDSCIFTASCMLKNINFTICLEVEKKSELYFLPTPVFEQLNNSNMAVKEYAVELLSSRFSDVMWVMEQVVFGSLPKRIATFLLDQYALDGTSHLQITHETIAHHVGTAREVVSRTLKYLENEGLVKVGRGEVDLTDLKRLRTFAEK